VTATAVDAVGGSPVPPALIVERVLERGRLSVLFRVLLLVPQLIVLYVLSLVGAILLLLGWVAALFTGQLPASFASYLSNLLAYNTRVLAYWMLLTDQYPPFGFVSEGYPVQVEVTPGRLNRLAVLFRLILLIPVALLTGLAQAGWWALSFFVWLIVLVTGRVPDAVFDSSTALLRYFVRYGAYFYLLTDVYPRGLFGDPPGPPEAAATYQDPSPAPGPFGYGVRVDQPAPAAPPFSPAPSRRLVLSAAAQRMLVAYLTIGAVVVVVYFIAIAALVIFASSGTSSNANASASLAGAHDTLGAQLQQFQQQTTACASGAASDRLKCVEAADSQVASAFDAFASSVGDIKFSSAASRTAAQSLSRVSHDLVSGFHDIAGATSQADYQTRVEPLAQSLSSFDQFYQALANTLTGTTS